MRIPGNAVLAVALLAFVQAPLAADERLIDAAKSRDRAAVRRLLDERVDVNTRYGDGTTALHWAAYWDDAETVDMLLSAKAAVNLANDLGIRPLALASANGNTAIVAKLLAAGANPDAAAVTGVTALMEAARAGHAAVARLLLEYGATADVVESTRQQTPLMWAIAGRHPEVVRALLDHGANVHRRSRANTRTVLLKDANDGSGVRSVKTARQIGVQVPNGGGTALMFSAWAGDLDSARQLIDAGANVDDQSEDGSTAVTTAIHGGHTPVALYLLEKGANPNLSTNYTALHVAALRKDLAAVKALLAQGANPNAPMAVGMPVRRFGLEWVIPATYVGATPLVVASSFLDADVVQALLAGGANPNLAMNDGTTALLASVGIGGRLERPAVSSGEPVCLNSAGFTIPCSDVDGAAGGDRTEGVAVSSNLDSQVLAVASLLKSAGANLNATSAQGDTALHGAASSVLPRVIQLLADGGADLNVTNKRGKTPLRLAIDASVKESGSPATMKSAELLRTLGARE